MSESYSSRQIRSARDAVTIGLAVIGLFGQIWWAQPAGTATRALIAWSDRICPAMKTTLRESVTVGNGAHRLDIAVVHRTIDALSGQAECAMRPFTQAT